MARFPAGPLPASGCPFFTARSPCSTAPPSVPVRRSVRSTRCLACLRTCPVLCLKIRCATCTPASLSLPVLDTFEQLLSPSQDFHHCFELELTRNLSLFACHLCSPQDSVLSLLFPVSISLPASQSFVHTYATFIDSCKIDNLHGIHHSVHLQSFGATVTMNRGANSHEGKRINRMKRGDPRGAAPQRRKHDLDDGQENQQHRKANQSPSQ